jgi:hypothetical protein
MVRDGSSRKTKVDGEAPTGSRGAGNAVRRSVRGRAKAIARGMRDRWWPAVQTIAMVVLAVPTIVLACEANRYIDQQNQIIRSEQVPQVRVGEEQIKNPETGQYAYDILKVRLRGGFVESLDVRHAEFLEITADSKDGSVRSAWRPLDGYYFATYGSDPDEEDGRTITGQVSGEGNHERFWRLDTDLRALNTGTSICQMKFHCYVAVSYTNALGEVQTVYYDSEGDRIDENAGSMALAFKESPFGEERLLSLYKLDAQGIRAAFDEDDAQGMTVAPGVCPWTE